MGNWNNIKSITFIVYIKCIYSNSFGCILMNAVFNNVVFKNIKKVSIFCKKNACIAQMLITKRTSDCFKTSLHRLYTLYFNPLFTKANKWNGTTSKKVNIEINLI